MRAPSASVDAGLLPLGKGIFLSKPKTSPFKAHGGGVGPSVVLIFGWLGAKLPHLKKYVQAYDGLYPEAAKIIIRTEPSFFWSTQTAKACKLLILNSKSSDNANLNQNAYLAPAIEALELLGCLPPPTNGRSELVSRARIEPVVPHPTPRVLVHTFSNGGSWQLVTFGELLASRGCPYSKVTSSPLCSALVLDSCPGACTVDSALRAFSGVVRNPLLRTLVRLIIRILYLYLALKRRFSPRGHRSILDSMKTGMNNPKLLPWFDGKQTKRLYIYSDSDDIVPADEIEGHARQAKEMGMQVRMRKFEDSPHVAHARTHPAEYWGDIRKLWEDTVRGAGVFGDCS